MYLKFNFNLTTVIRKISSFPGAFKLGSIGGINVYINKEGEKDWPTGRIAIALDNNIIKVFNIQEWTENPNHDNPERKVKLGSDEFYLINKHSEAAKEIILRDYIRDSMYSYLVICHLLQDGYSFSKHRSWASYLVTKISRILKEENSIKKLIV